MDGLRRLRRPKVLVETALILWAAYRAACWIGGWRR